MINDDAELMTFIGQNQQESASAQQTSSNRERITWEVRGDRLHFVKARKEVSEIPSYDMINLSLDYATELNRIIWTEERTKFCQLFKICPY